MRPLSLEAAQQAAGPVTPASTLFDPFDAAYLRDPHPTLARLRAMEPVFFSPSQGSWVVMRHAAVRQVLRDTARFSSRIVNDPITPLCPMARSVIADSEFDVPPLLVNNDPPSHSRFRAFFSKPLDRPRYQSLVGFIDQTVAEHVERLAVGHRPADLVSALTWDVPALVLFKLLGVPQEDVPQVKRWADSRAVLTWGRPTADEQVRLSTGAVEFYRYAAELVQRKAADPADDVVSDFVRLREGSGGEAITLHEITGMVFNLLFAGHETTSSAAASMFATVLARPALWQAVCEGRQAADPVVEESLRFEPPIMAWRRLAKEDVEVDGVRMPAGSKLLLMLGAANRDPEQFERPDEFLPGRKEARNHLTFGLGTHFCVGAPLARLELAAMLAQVARRLPGMSLVPDQAMDYSPNTSVRALRALHVTW